MKLIFTFLLFISVHTTFSQLTLKGIIKDARNNEALAGVTVSEKGIQNSVITQIDGSYSIQYANNTSTLIISYIGYNTQELKVGANTRLNIFLIPSNAILKEVVVTALGIQRDKKELGYAVQTLRTKDITDVKQTNLVNALAGKLSGVQVTNGSSGIGSSSRIVIRGENSLSGTNQPLFVVDGIPISNNAVTNNTENNESGFQEVDYGNGAAEINPDDIESITVLKGAGAAALYGSRAAGGVVVINTKNGSGTKGKGITFSSSLTLENPLVLPKYQNEYGAGAGGLFFYEDGFGAGKNDGGLTSFGPRITGQLIKQFNGPSKDKDGNPVRGADIFARNGNPIEATPFLAHPNNVKDFYNTGRTFINTVSFNTGSEKTKLRLSYSNLDNKGIVPNTDLKRNSFSFSGLTKMSDKISARAFVNFINSSSTNRPAVGYGSENPMYTFNWSGRQVDFKDLKNYWQADKKDFNQFNANYLWLDNPYFTAYENTNGFIKNRVLGNAEVNYALTNSLNIRFRSGLDFYNDLRKSKRAFSTKRFANGAYREDEITYNEMNTDALITYQKQLSKNIKFNLSAGGNILNQKTNYKSNVANQLSVPGIYNFGNSKVPLVSTQQNSEKTINSLYTFGGVGYKDFLFADVTLRNDWSSTLPAKNNSYAYYSASVALLLSKIIKLPEVISYSKLRLSYAKVGSDTDPYQLNNTYVFNQNYGSTPLLTSSTGLLNPDLKPERLDALELGTELYFFKDRLGLDASVYQNTSTDQIINLPASSSSGYATRLVNGGKIQSRGLEISLRGVPVLRNNFRWNTNVNFSVNRSRVTRLPNNVEQYVTGFESLYISSDNSVFFIATPANKGRVGDIFGTGLLEVNGQTVYDAKGFPVRDPNLRNLGNYNPNFMVGFGNELSYKNVSLNFLWDWRQGGVFLSRTFSLGSTSGVLQSTLPGREAGIIGEGITNIGTAASPQYVPNTKSISAADYYGQYYNRANEATSIFNASYVKLRQVSLSYNFSKKIAQKLSAENLKLGIILNNVLLFTKNPNVDPELNAVQGRKYVNGVDDMSLPSSRSYGINLNVNF
ncbi:MAG: SusC/RagA family TonB-linked outer membrane protein [Ferruginibacter sp.]